MVQTSLLANKYNCNDLKDVFYLCYSYVFLLESLGNELNILDFLLYLRSRLLIKALVVGYLHLSRNKLHLCLISKHHIYVSYYEVIVKLHVYM